MSLVAFGLVMARVLGLLLAAPVFSTRTYPRRVQAALAAALAAALLPAVGTPSLPSDAVAVAGLAIGELAIGYALGMLARLLVSSFQLAAALLGFQAGFAMASAFDPDSTQGSTVIERLHVNFATALFLLVDGHHSLVRALAASLESFPLGAAVDTALWSRVLFASAGDMFEAGARIAAPVTGILLFANATIGLLNRVMPQFSIFNVGFPLQVMAGMVAALLALPSDAAFFLRAWDALEEQLAMLVG
jgi:flagellar biosynthetic protein FliR